MYASASDSMLTLGTHLPRLPEINVVQSKQAPVVDINFDELWAYSLTPRDSKTDDRELQLEREGVESEVRRLEQGGAESTHGLMTIEIQKELSLRDIPLKTSKENIRILRQCLESEHEQLLTDLTKKLTTIDLKIERMKSSLERREEMRRELNEEEVVLCQDVKMQRWLKMVKDNRSPDSATLHVSPTMARIIAKALAANCSILTLDLSSNHLDDKAGAHLATMLVHNTFLTKLELNNNLMGPSSAAAFGKALQTNGTLSYLGLDGNQLLAHDEYHGVETLSRMLACNQTLLSLNLWNTGLDSLAVHSLVVGLNRNRHLISMELSSTHTNPKTNELDTLKMHEALLLVQRKLGDNMVLYEARMADERAERMVLRAERAAVQRKLDDREKKRDEMLWAEGQRAGRRDHRRAELEAVLMGQEEDLMMRVRAKEKAKSKSDSDGKKGKKGKKGGKKGKKKGKKKKKK